MNDTTITRDELDILIAKIEKLWRKANDTAATEAERQAFEAKALALMERYRIDQAMLDLSGDDPLVDVLYGELSGRYGRTHISLIDAVARAYDCRVWWRGYGMKYSVYLFGFKSDTERVKRIAGLLLNDAVTRASKTTLGHIGETFNWRRSFIIGYTREIRARFREASALAREEHAAEAGVVASESVALVLVNRAEQVNKTYAQKGIRSAASTRSAGGSGYYAGAEAARHADLSGGNRGVSGGRRALAS